MTDTPVPHFGIMKLGDEFVALSPTPLNVIYFEEAPSLSHMNGVIGVTLAFLTRTCESNARPNMRACFPLLTEGRSCSVSS